jgi:putative tryptophan/tyrosine transport system substrate-binding protein
MKRRAFITLLTGVAAWPLAARGQQTERMRRIGFLRVGQPPNSFVEGFRRGLRDHGLVEGQSIAIEWGLAPSVAKLPDTLSELIRLKADVLLASGTSSVLLTRDAAGTLPVVFVAAVDPVAMGLIPGLARPSGTITGITTVAEELNGKRLELLRQLIPNLSTVAFLVRADSPATAEHMKLAERATRTLGVHLQVIAVRDGSELERAFPAAQGAGALLVVDDSVFTAQRTKIAELAVKNRLPTMYGHRDMVLAGGLMTYGPDYEDLYRRAADYVFKILKGAKPSDLPVEQPTKFEFILNLKTAKALGLTIPEAFLARADEVIE